MISALRRFNMCDNQRDQGTDGGINNINKPSTLSLRFRLELEIDRLSKQLYSINNVLDRLAPEAEKNIELLRELNQLGFLQL